LLRAVAVVHLYTGAGATVQFKLCGAPPPPLPCALSLLCPKIYRPNILPEPPPHFLPP
jgi:hypothetical protein